MAEKIPVGILGATGLVGQQLIALLACHRPGGLVPPAAAQSEHPWFHITELYASERSVGKSYRDATAWRVDGPLPERIARLTLRPAERVGDAQIVFSALDAQPAAELEPRFAGCGANVVSNASAHRMAPDVPLLIPEINAEHIEMVRRQRSSRGWSGSIITNPNCTATALTLALAPLERRFGLREVFVATLQSVSGAGYPGNSAIDLIDNVVPFIPAEEAKIESEPKKILGGIANTPASGFQPADFSLHVHVHRVAVRWGHLVSVTARLRKEAMLTAVREAFERFYEDSAVDLPSAVRPVLILRDEPDRPQPRWDTSAGGGMQVTVGRLRMPAPDLVQFSALGHNLIRGAAGAALLNAELLVSHKLVRA
jgi:aspartate-semialdehyde dehydrogenase